MKSDAHIQMIPMLSIFPKGMGRETACNYFEIATSKERKNLQSIFHWTSVLKMGAPSMGEEKSPLRAFRTNIL